MSQPCHTGQWARKAVAAGPSSADAHATAALVFNSAGLPEEAIPAAQKAMRLSPSYPAWYLYQLANAQRLTGRCARGRSRRGGGRALPRARRLQHRVGTFSLA